MVKTYLKTFARTFRHHLTRLVSIVLMVLVSIGFCAGIGMAKDKIDYALDDVYREKNVSDLIVKSTAETGFTKEEISLLEERYGAENVLTGGSFELRDGVLDANGFEIVLEGLGEGITRIYFFSRGAEELDQNVLETVESYETNEGYYPLYAERATSQLVDFGEDARFRIKSDFLPLNYNFELAGVVFNPLHMAVRDDPSFRYEDELLSHIVYVFDFPLLTDTLVNDVYITFPERDLPVLSDEYETKAKAERDAVLELLPSAAALTLFENFSFVSFHEYGNKIEGIGLVMMVVFLLVTLLIVLSTMTRFLDEERSEIACLQTLGYPALGILSKYLLFAFVGTAIGGAGSYFASIGLAYIIYINFTWNFTLPPYPARISVGFFFLVASVILLSALAATLIAGLRMTRRRPAELLRPKAPRPGKKVLLESIPLLWNRLSFRYKSSLRNVFRYKTRFFMTVVAVMASTALVLAGLAVLDCCIFQDVGTAAMIGVAIVVLLFAALLNAVVIYTLTNINVSERTRELATLMVLGYSDREVTGYVYREIYLTSSIGIALGLPFGCILCLFIFNVMEFGSVPLIGWYVWLCAPLLSLLFTFLVTLMLRRRIVRIPMNDSLKAIE